MADRLPSAHQDFLVVPLNKGEQIEERKHAEGRVLQRETHSSEHLSKQHLQQSNLRFDLPQLRSCNEIS